MGLFTRIVFLTAITTGAVLLAGLSGPVGLAVGAAKGAEVAFLTINAAEVIAAASVAVEAVTTAAVITGAAVTTAVVVNGAANIISDAAERVGDFIDSSNQQNTNGNASSSSSSNQQNSNGNTSSSNKQNGNSNSSSSSNQQNSNGNASSSNQQNDDGNSNGSNNKGNSNNQKDSNSSEWDYSDEGDIRNHRYKYLNKNFPNRSGYDQPLEIDHIIPMDVWKKLLAEIKKYPEKDLPAHLKRALKIFKIILKDRDIYSLNSSDLDKLKGEFPAMEILKSIHRSQFTTGNAKLRGDFNDLFVKFISQGRWDQVIENIIRDQHLIANKLNIDSVREIGRICERQRSFVRYLFKKGIISYEELKKLFDVIANPRL